MPSSMPASPLKEAAPHDRRRRAANKSASTGISQIVLIAALPLGGGLTASAVAKAIAAGLAEVGPLSVDLLPLHESESLEAADFDARMRASRAVVIASPRLDENTLLRSLPFEIATRARQAGVPAYAVTRENALELFDARILDLQLVIEARSAKALHAAGTTLAGVV